MKITIFNGKTDYFDWAIFNSKLLVSLPEGNHVLHHLFMHLLGLKNLFFHSNVRLMELKWNRM